MNNNLKFIYYEFIKFFEWALITLICMLVIIGVAYLDISRTGVISENFFTEYLQKSLLFICVCIFAYISKKYRQYAVILVCGFLMCMLIREWDAVFDKIFHGAWKFIALPTAALSCYFAFRTGKENLVKELAFFMQMRAYNILLLGLMIVLIISRVLGMRSIILLFAGIDFNEGMKNFMEESFELLGYLIIFISSILYLREYKLLCKK